MKSEEYIQIFNSLCPSLSLPNTPRLFFLWMWQEFYGDENYLINDFSMYHEDKTSWLVGKIIREQKEL